MQGYGLIAIQNDVRLNYLQFNAVCNLIILCFDSFVGYCGLFRFSRIYSIYIGDSAVTVRSSCNYKTVFVYSKELVACNIADLL